MKFVATKKETTTKESKVLTKKEALLKKKAEQKAKQKAKINRKIFEKIIKNIEILNKKGAELTMTKELGCFGSNYYRFSNIFCKNNDIPYLHFAIFDNNFELLTETLKETNNCLKTFKKQVKFQKRLNALEGK